jgi:L-arabinose transport system ATP-binding protein
MALCPEDRKTQGLALIRTVRENISMSILDKITKFSFIDFKKERELCEKGIRDFNIKTPSMNQQVIKLSGGNQQKIILARWLASNPKVLILDEPTKGIDVGAKSEVYKLICNIAKQGIGIIVISSELPEVIGLCDRIMVMNQGRVAGEVERSEATEETILRYAMLGMSI